MRLQDDCERILENWLATSAVDPIEEPSSSEPLIDHLLNCTQCRQLVRKIQRDRELLGRHFSGFEIPRARVLDYRDALTAASGHPRRVSLTLLPLFFAVILLLGMLAAYLFGKWAQKSRPEPPAAPPAVTAPVAIPEPK
jgi:hypothetical protein